MTLKNTYFSKSLEKGLMILSLFTKETPELTQTNISQKLNLNKTSTYRYVNTLIEMGYLERDKDTKHIRPSIFCIAFCNNLINSTNYEYLVRQLVDEVHERENISIDVALCVGNNVVRIYYKQAKDTLTYKLDDVTISCLHNTALGKAYLSALPKQDIENKISQMELPVRTEKTISDRKVLLKELQEAKHNGYALNKEEYLQGIIAIAAPLVNPRNGEAIGGVSLDFSTVQRSIEEVEEQFASVVIELAQKISAALPN